MDKCYILCVIIWNKTFKNYQNFTVSVSVLWLCLWFSLVEESSRDKKKRNLETTRTGGRSRSLGSPSFPDDGCTCSLLHHLTHRQLHCMFLFKPVFPAIFFCLSCFYCLFNFHLMCICVPWHWESLKDARSSNILWLLSLLRRRRRTRRRRRIRRRRKVILEMK